MRATLEDCLRIVLFDSAATGITLPKVLLGSGVPLFRRLQPPMDGMQVISWHAITVTSRTDSGGIADDVTVVV